MRGTADDAGLPEAGAQLWMVRAMGAISLATLASRLLGFLRDVTVAHAFGAGLLTDAFFVAFRIPNLLRRLLAEGALATALIPVFTEFLTVRSREEFNRMLRAVAGGLLVALSLAILLGILLAPWLVRIMAPGFAADPEQVGLAIRLTRLMFPYLLFVGLAALAMGVLNVHRRFFTSALGPAVLNVGMIAAVFLLAPRLEVPIQGLAFGVLAGGLGQFLIQLPEVRQTGVPLLPSAEFSHPALGRVARLLGPSVFGLAAVQLNVFVNTLLASLLATGSISYLYYADRVVQFPLGVFGIAVATATLPSMAEQASRRDLAALVRTLNFALRLSCFVAIPASVGLIMLRLPITRLLFERGQFGAAETQATAWALAFYALGLTAFSGTRIAAQVFYALGDPRTPVQIGIGAVVVNVLFALAFMRPLAHGGLALAASGASTANLAGLLWLLRRRLGPLGGRRLATSLALTAGATLLMALWCWLVLGWWPAEASPWTDAGWLGAAIGGSLVLYALISAGAKSDEWAALTALASRRRPLLPPEASG
ncbi:MAG: murein biosynthesis integral membrane protein MurJ [Candidatus Methylomirabilia bacterium]